MRYVRATGSFLVMLSPLVLGFVAGILFADDKLKGLSVLFFISAFASLLYNYQCVMVQGVGSERANIPALDSEPTDKEIRMAAYLGFDHRRMLRSHMPYKKVKEFPFEDGWLIFLRDPRYNEDSRDGIRIFFTMKKIEAEKILFDVVKQEGVFRHKTIVV